MAEMQKQTSSGAQSSRRFLQFLMMQAQNALYLLGQIPSPDGRPMPPNLEAAKMLIDQLEMIKEKTHGNLSSDEQHALDNTLTNLQLTFVEVSGGVTPGMMPETSSPEIDDWAQQAAEPDAQPPSAPAGVTPDPGAAASKKSDSHSGESDEGDKRRFVKSYG